MEQNEKHSLVTLVITQPTRCGLPRPYAMSFKGMRWGASPRDFGIIDTRPFGFCFVKHFQNKKKLLSVKGKKHHRLVDMF
jgi:hypothetical protein